MSEQEQPDTEPTATAKAPLDTASKSAIMSSIHNLDKNNPDHFTKEGHPRVDVLTEMCGFKVTRADVVEVWGEEGAAEAATVADIDDIATERKSEAARRINQGPESEPIKCLKMFEVLMEGSRNTVLRQILDHWRTDGRQAIELDLRLRARGRY